MCPRHEGRTSTGTLHLSTAFALGAAVLSVLGAALGVATHNIALTSVSLSIACGGAIGWLLAGRSSKRNG
ncbi:MAG: hypothetical protein AMJ93_05620 [Anaerolineae bacterium SM23_84]|nr:MAG: hypothetical protein AMJ93_05620 [Anaerolineae bacterium SM23_84]